MLGRPGSSKTGPLGSVMEVSFTAGQKLSGPDRSPRVAANPDITKSPSGLAASD